MSVQKLRDEHMYIFMFQQFKNNVFVSGFDFFPSHISANVVVLSV